MNLCHLAGDGGIFNLVLHFNPIILRLTKSEFATLRHVEFFEQNIRKSSEPNIFLLNLR